MNLEEIRKYHKLREYRGSESFGDLGQLEVKFDFTENSVRFFVLYCYKCAEDVEMFGEGYFISRVGNIRSGKIPCGCSLKYIPTKQQRRLLIERKALELNLELIDLEYDEKGQLINIILNCPEHGVTNRKSVSSFIRLGHKCRGCIRKDRLNREDPYFKEFLSNLYCGPKLYFLGWKDSYEGKDTFCRMSCQDHGEWTTTTLGSLLYNNTGCPGCATEKIAESTTKEIDHFLSRFKEVYPSKDLVWKRSEENRNVWSVKCNICNYIKTDYVTNYYAGKLECWCEGVSEQRYSYISIIMDDDIPVALKFGISKNPRRRMKEQDRATIYSVKILGVWEFDTKENCLSTEAICKSQLICGILPYEEFRDGTSETTSPSNYDKIVRIYEEYGGIKIDT